MSDELWWFEGIKQGVVEHVSGICRYCGCYLRHHKDGCLPIEHREVCRDWNDDDA